jgi:amino-acid N-acetyltransferase
LLRTWVLFLRGMAEDPMQETLQVAPLLRPAKPEDQDAVVGLVASAGLPTPGVEIGLAEFVVAEYAGRIVGVAGLETYGADGLLRSVAVAEDWRGRGLGGELTRSILDAARRRGLTNLYLLTETAADFFSRFGFRPIRREDASEAIRASEEFRDLCPVSSTVMVRSVAVAP